MFTFTLPYLYFYVRKSVTVGVSVGVSVLQKFLADWLIENNPNKAKLHDSMGYSIIPPS